MITISSLDSYNNPPELYLIMIPNWQMKKLREVGLM